MTAVFKMFQLVDMNSPHATTTLFDTARESFQTVSDSAMPNL
jgi:hypothetical protein